MFTCFQGDQKSFDNFAGAMLHGNGSNRWFDKSFNLVITPNGRVTNLYDILFFERSRLHIIMCFFLQKGCCIFNYFIITRVVTYFLGSSC